MAEREIAGAGKGSAELPLFIRTYDFVGWLVPLTNHFPRAHRHTVTKRLLDAALDFQQIVLLANYVFGETRLAQLRLADTELDKIRLYLRLAHRWQWINIGQYEHASALVAELGRPLGGWQKVTRQTAGQPGPAAVGTG